MPGPSGIRNPVGGVISGSANRYTTAPLYYTTAPLCETIREMKLRWSGHAERKNEEDVVMMTY